MITYSIKIEGRSDFCYGKHVAEKKTSEETHEQYEERTWKQKIHCDPDTQECFIQPFAIKNGLESAAKWLSMGIPGDYKKTFTKRFTSGVLVYDRVSLSNGNGHKITQDKVVPLWLFVPSNGQRGGPKRVERVFPVLSKWSGVFEVVVLDEKITHEVLEKHLEAFGRFIGLGSMRVENGGVNGRFAVLECVQVKTE